MLVDGGSEQDTYVSLLLQQVDAVTAEVKLDLGRLKNFRPDRRVLNDYPWIP
ncbi:hypothetical protein J6590_098087 [Homalodisca vitripennis]|nr:hypothetical protein J6590_098087 [Homalodisca vitripennis]